MGKFSIKEFINKNFFNEKWTCNLCGKEIFNNEYFCKECVNKLSFNDGEICLHCGRKVFSTENYCETCKNKITHIDKGRSVFVYKDEIAFLLQSFKFDNKRYFAKIFAEYMSKVFFQNFIKTDYLIYVPMYIKDERKRGYNQTRLLAEELSKIINIQVLSDAVLKVKSTKRQLTLNREARLKNLSGAFKVFNKKSIDNKNILIIDDVTTTGSTAETLAILLKNSGAREVNLLTVASVGKAY